MKKNIKSEKGISEFSTLNCTFIDIYKNLVKDKVSLDVYDPFADKEEVKKAKDTKSKNK